MSKKLSPEQTFELSKAFHKLSVVLGEYRFENWNQLTGAQRNDLENMEWTLLNTASDLNAKSVVMSVNLLDEHVKTLTTSTTAMKNVVKKIQGIKHAIRIGAKAVALGGAIASRNLPAIMSTAKDLIAEIG